MRLAAWAVLPLLALALGGCVVAPPQPVAVPVQRLDPAELARIEAAQAALRPISLDEIVARSRSTPPEVLIDQIRTTGTHYGLNPSQVLELRQKGVQPVVLDALADAHERWLRDQAAADKHKREVEQADALARAKAEAEAARRRELDAYRRYPDPFFYPEPYYVRPAPGWRRWP
jgi:hypothetical protein